jgi:glutamyl-tRNA synthetase
MPGLKERAKTLIELIEGARYLWSERPLQLDDKASSILTEETRTVLHELAHDLATLETWDAQATERVVRAFAERRETKLANVAQPLRAALTGRTTSPPIFDVLAVLGKDESLARLRDQARAP